MVFSANTDFEKVDLVVATLEFKLTNKHDFRQIAKTAFGAPFLIVSIPGQAVNNDCLAFPSGSSQGMLPALVPDKDYLMIVIKQEYQQLLHDIQHILIQSESTEMIDYRVILQEMEKTISNNHFQTVSSITDIIRKRKGLVTVNQLSSEVALSPRHLSRLFRQHCKLGLKEIISMQRLKQTFIYIASGVPVERALFTQNFYDFSHFSKACQKHLYAKPHQLTQSNLFLEAIKYLYFAHNR